MDKKAKAYFSKAAFVVAKSSVVMYSCLIFKNDSLLEFQSNQKTHKTDIDMECKHWYWGKAIRKLARRDVWAAYRKEEKWNDVN